MEEQGKKLGELLALGDGFLARKRIPEARTICELLAARLYKCGRLELYRFLEDRPEPRIVEALRRGLQRIVQGEPVQYVLGQWDFRSLTLKVDRRALIPRPETEQLIDWVLKSARLKTGVRPLIVDVGTGTGCIILSLAKEVPDGVFVGLDVSPEALSLAIENAEMTGLSGRVMFAESDGCGEFDPGSVDILVSNPPYIASDVVNRLPPHILAHEPRVALDGGPDGLEVYRSLLLDAVMVLKPGGELFLEIGNDQGTALRELLEAFGFTEIRIVKDYSGHDRFAIAVQSV